MKKGACFSDKISKSQLQVLIAPMFDKEKWRDAFPSPPLVETTPTI